MTELVGGDILFGHNLYRGEIFLKPGAFDFAGLLRHRALGHQNQVMALGQILQRLRHSGQEFHRMAGNGVGKSVDSLVQGRGQRFDGQALEGLDQRVRKTVQTIAMADDGLALHLVQHFAHLLGSVLVVIQERNKVRDGALKVDVIFPKRIVGIDQQGLRTIRDLLPQASST